MKLPETQGIEVLLSKKELAQALRVSPRTINNLMSANKLPYFRVGTHPRFHLSQVMAAIQQEAK